ncbi:hypothetical protein KIH86_19855, partial [Paenibacillus sp. HN-1]
GGVLNFKWKHGEVISMELRAKRDLDISINMADQLLHIELKKGQTYQVSSNDKGESCNEL